LPWWKLLRCKTFFRKELPDAQLQHGNALQNSFEVLYLTVSNFATAQQAANSACFNLPFRQKTASLYLYKSK
jgi:hypothetical protein